MDYKRNLDVKVITFGEESTTRLESAINDFLADGNIEIIDVQYQTSLPDNSDYCSFSCMLMYKDEYEKDVIYKAKVFEEATDYDLTDSLDGFFYKTDGALLSLKQGFSVAYNNYKKEFVYSYSALVLYEPMTQKKGKVKRLS